MSDMHPRGRRNQQQQQHQQHHQHYQYYQQQLLQLQPQFCSCCPGHANEFAIAAKQHQQPVKRRGSPIDYNDLPSPPPSMHHHTRSRAQPQLQHQQLMLPRASRLELMPTEILFRILASPGVLDADDLGRLALTSHGFLKLVGNFVKTVYGKRMLTPPVPTIKDLVECSDIERVVLLGKFSRAGRLLKRLTCLLPLPERMNQLAVCVTEVCRVAPKDPHLFAVAGASASALQSGWPEEWLARAMPHLLELFPAMPHLLELFPAMPFIGRSPNRLRIITQSIGMGVGRKAALSEALVRHFCRFLLLGGLSETQRANRLAQLVLDWPDLLVSRLLFCLYGPLFEGRPMWTDMTRSTAANARQICACFGELGAALTGLGQTAPMRSRLIGVAESLLEFPSNWLSENAASLMHTAGPEFAARFLISRARKGYVKELVMLLTSFCLVSIKVETPIDAVVTMIVDTHAVLRSTRDRDRLLNEFSDSFRRVIFDLYENDGIGDRLEDFATLLDAQAALTQALLRRLTENRQANHEE